MLKRTLTPHTTTFAVVAFILLLTTLLYIANTQGTGVFNGITGVIPYGDKVGHCLLYGLLTWVMIVFTKHKVFAVKSVAIYWGTAITFAFTSIEEGSQLFLSTRTFDWMDLLANAIGIGIATLTVSLSLKVMKLKKNIQQQ